MLDRVDYTALDRAKNAFIEAGKRTRNFAAQFGFMPGDFGGSANVFALDLKAFAGAEALYMTLLPEGLGTADDARPDDLTSEELVRFWKNIGGKTMSVLTNDAASAGMQTVLISLYLPSATVEAVFSKEFMRGFLDGFVAGCEKVGCVYFSGETPQLKGKIVEGKLDIAGALWGVVPAGARPVDSSELRAGDFIVFVESSGPHENGFTTLRDLATRLPQGYRTKLPGGMEYWEAINQPGHLYTPLVQAVMAAGIQPSNVEPITGHGWQKLMRPKGAFRYVVEEVLPVPEIFTFVEETSGLSKEVMLRTFNYGVGLALYVHSREDAEKVVGIAEGLNLKACVAGKVEAAEAREVVVKPLGVTMKGDGFDLGK
ncbi:phosphoribosylformylglycinamidine cyclo-ligase [Candidatus Peregrinibacteria bacterium RIFCSPLOWO2_01_FULL_48_20]|nr:MAG: phosphoribosylformylglycinamidine cyclo-ligase [Candidatus Peregrinibacteria bacterium RIFCSPLOWO2_01_FULL_48_20]